MSKRESIARYNLIIKKLRKKSSSFMEIFDYLAIESEIQGYNYTISKRTFQRDIEDIRSVYNIDIQYDFSRKVYYIDSDDQPEVNERICEAFDTFNALNISERLSDFIHFEKRRPQGTENLNDLLHAIKKELQIRFLYQKFWEDTISSRIAEPYAIKEFKNRWYLLAKDLKDNRVKSFALDRLSDLEITKKKFQLPKKFNVNEHFRYCFGIISPNEHTPTDVLLSLNPIQGKYIKTLPLHETQEVIVDNADELRIKLRLYITHDFVMEVLSLGDNVKVLEPLSLIQEIQSVYESALKLYP